MLQSMGSQRNGHDWVTEQQQLMENHLSVIQTPLEKQYSVTTLFVDVQSATIYSLFQCLKAEYNWSLAGISCISPLGFVIFNIFNLVFSDSNCKVLISSKIF